MQKNLYKSLTKLPKIQPSKTFLYMNLRLSSTPHCSQARLIIRELTEKDGTLKL
jgi:hypothetical protein